MLKSLSYRNAILLINRSQYQTTIGKKRFEFFQALALEKTQIRLDLTSPSFSKLLKFAFSWLMTSFQSVFKSLSYFTLTLLYAGYSHFYLCLLLFFLLSSRRILPILASFLTFLRVFLYSTPFTSYFLQSHCLFLSSLFSLEPSLLQLELSEFPPVGKALAMPVLLLRNLIRNCKILRINVQIQPHQFDFPLKMRFAN